jgi:hypothetical protein
MPGVCGSRPCDSIRSSYTEVEVNGKTVLLCKSCNAQVSNHPATLKEHLSKHDVSAQTSSTSNIVTANMTGAINHKRGSSISIDDSVVSSCNNDVDNNLTG